MRGAPPPSLFLKALGTPVEIACDRDVDRERVAMVFGAMHAPLGGGRPLVRLQVTCTGPMTARPRWCAMRDVDVIVDASDPVSLLLALDREVATTAIAETGDAAFIHAAAACDSRGALLLAGSKGCGKSTLVARLVQRGFGYLADDTAPIDVQTLQVRPFPRPLRMKQGAEELFVPWGSRLLPCTRLTDATDARPALVAPAPEIVPPAPSPIRAIVFPHFTPGAACRIARRRPAEVLVDLMELGYRVAGQDRAPAFRALAQLVRTVPCFGLEYSQLDEAVRAATSALASVVSNP